MDVISQLQKKLEEFNDDCAALLDEAKTKIEKLESEIDILEDDADELEDLKNTCEQLEEELSAFTGDHGIRGTTLYDEYKFEILKRLAENLTLVELQRLENLLRKKLGRKFENHYHVE